MKIGKCKSSLERCTWIVTEGFPANLAALFLIPAACICRLGIKGRANGGLPAPLGPNCKAGIPEYMAGLMFLWLSCWNAPRTPAKFWFKFRPYWPWALSNEVAGRPGGWGGFGILAGGSQSKGLAWFCSGLNLLSHPTLCRVNLPFIMSSNGHWGHWCSKGARSNRALT